ncbi:hypothetical protein B0I35DRAFT_472765 [Stachybotrys elegans]|uniref:Elongation factor 2 n=1 Tax=Stachybotrys elegans TaxID=80388 RepID=A0A8K0T4Q0_9HYPO|nr:hypothetical protein B0I35DRAFT_472765 [Stachybotrys elegans]
MPDQPFEPQPSGFNPIFLIFLLLSSVLAVFFVLYFNRLFSSVVSYGIRTWTWHQYRVYIDITALQVSLLAGRIFFSGLRYHGSNETFHIQHGYITWRYWLRRVRDPDLLASATKEDNTSARERNANLPCRINVNIVGLEWFIYNRSPAYDAILEGLTKTDPPSSRSSDGLDEKETTGLRPRRTRSHTGDANLEKENMPRPSRVFSGGTARTAGGSTIPEQDGSKLPLFLQLFPIYLDCQKAAVVMGNENTKAILIVKADSVSGDIDATETSTPDPYRQTIKIDLQHPVIEIRENEDYKEDPVARAMKQRQNVTEPEPLSSWLSLRQHRRRLMSSLRNMVPYWRKSVESFSTDSRPATNGAAAHLHGTMHWQGLSRYLDDQDQDDKAWWSSVEYAAVSRILDSPAATFNIYWDAVSKVAEQACAAASPSLINGDEPPAWGMHLSIKGGNVNYGPWADRQRAELQRVFFPSLSKDATPASPLPAGSWRVPTQFKLFVDFLDTVTLRVPVREESKNWRWRDKGRQETPTNDATKRRQRNRTKKGNKGEASHLRPSGWLEVKLPADSTVTYSMDMLATASGFGSFLDIDLPSTELWSSVNQDLLWRSGTQRISCDLSTPLTWNALRTWQFNIVCHDLKMFLLRDHIFLLTDLVDDWAGGPPPEYLIFTPFLYKLNLDFKNLMLYLNVNDENIIDKPTELRENSYLILSSPNIKVESCIPLDKYRPHKSAIPFDAQISSLDLAFRSSQWNTPDAFVPSNEVGHAEALAIKGSYEYNATTSPTNIDTLTLHLHGQSPNVYLYGFLVRYFLVLKDNYFGEHVHFRTLDEYQSQLSSKELTADNQAVTKPPPKKSNDLDVILSVKVDDPRIMLPVNLYSANRYIQCELANIAIDLRFTNYYMDLELELSPLNLSSANTDDDVDSPWVASNTQLFIDGVRIYGHRLFGLPPAELAYWCNWDVAVGAVKGECTAEFLAALSLGGGAFNFTFDDVENALVPYSSLVFHDVTFARVSVESVRLWLRVDDAAFLLSTQTIEIDHNDWARSHYTARSRVHIPDLQLSCVNADVAARHKTRHQQPVEASAFIRTDVYITIIGRKFQFTNERKLQQEAIQHEDQRTGRAQFLALPGLIEEFVPEAIDPPAQPSPTPPVPVFENDVDETSTVSATTLGTSRRSWQGKRPRSFLSLSSSSSVRRPRSRVESRNEGQKYERFSFKSSEALRPGLRAREHSTSTGRHSAFYSAVGDHAIRDSLGNSSIAFSSLYYPPSFPLDGVHPDNREAPFPSIEQDDGDDFISSTTATLEDIDPANLSESHAHSSMLLEFPAGITAMFHPSAARHTASLLAALQPTEPDDLLDSLQANTMTGIFEAQKQAAVTGQIDDIMVRLPKASFRFLNSSTLDSPSPVEEEQDQYDVLVSQVALVTRTVTDWEDRMDNNTKKPRTSLHLRVKAVEASASERLSPLQEPQAALMVQLNNIMVSMGTKDVQYIDADIASIVGTTASSKIEYLAALVHRTEHMASDLGTCWSKALTRHDNRLKYLAYRLLEEGPTTIDPSFLIRPSAVLRSARGHLRTTDSWKMAMRLRQIWVNLDSNAKSQVIRDCVNESWAVPPDAAELVVAAFQRWRSWDLEDARHAALITNIFGQQKPSDSANQRYPILGAIRVREAQFVLDRTGPSENKIQILDLSARFEDKISPIESSRPELAHSTGSVMTVNVCCSDASINVNWELCELVEGILRLYSRPQPQTQPRPSSSVEQKRPETPKQHQTTFHVVAEIIKGSIQLETINLSVKVLSDGLKVSALTCATGPSKTLNSLVLNCKAVTLRTHSHSQLLGMSQLKGPTVCLSLEQWSTEPAALNTIKASANSQAITLSVEQDIIALMEVVDLLVRDELAHFYRLSSQFSSTTRPKAPPPPSSQDVAKYNINVAMFVDVYTISVPILQSLVYVISGVVSRACCSVNERQDVTFDFDVKENLHEVQVKSRNQRRSISRLQIPPLNGRVTSHNYKSVQVLTILSSIEVVKLDASSVYSLLAALNQPHVTSAIQEMQQQGKIIQSHITDVFGPKEETTLPRGDAVKSSLVYNMQMTLAGLQVSARTSLKSKLEPWAEVLFSLDRICLQVSNRHDARSPILKYPELHMDLKKGGLDIWRGRKDEMRSCGSMGGSFTVSASTRPGDDGKEEWSFIFKSDDFNASLSPDTVSTVVDVLGYLGNKIKDLDTSRELEYIKKLRHSKPRILVNDREESGLEDSDILDSVLASVMYRFELRNIRVSWDVAGDPQDMDTNKEDLVLSIGLIEFGTRTKRSARLAIEHFQLQTVPPGQDKSLRSLHSALLPQVIFNIGYVSTPDTRRMAFQASGESLDLRLTPGFIVPAANLVDSITLSIKNVQHASAQWITRNPESQKPQDAPASGQQPSMFGNRRMENLLIVADFDGAVVHISSQRPTTDVPGSSRQKRPSLGGKYGQFNADDTGSAAVLRSPGLAWKAEYQDNGKDDPYLYGEIKIDASSNILHPSVVPLVMDIISGIQEVVRDDSENEPSPSASIQPKLKSEKSADEDNILTADPSAVLGRLKLNLGLRICKQEFSLSCQPVAFVAATARFESIYFTVNTVHSSEQGNFFAISGTFNSLQASVQHVYSRESTGSFDIDRISLSLLNSKHVSGISGVSAIVKISPMKVSINAKQVQDFLLFREIWYPKEMRQGSAAPVAKLMAENSQGHLVQRYQQVAATAAFPWTATISIEALDVAVDLGQAIGRSVFRINDFWVWSKKTSDWEQNLCIGFNNIGIDCTGRLSGFITLQDFRLRSSIHWPKREEALNETPLVQASLRFKQFRVKAAFDYQAFLIADITSLEYLMYNIRRGSEGSADRLVAIFDGEAVQVFGTTSSTAQAVALYQAIKKLLEEKRESFQASLLELEKFKKRKHSTSRGTAHPSALAPKLAEDDSLAKSPISLDTDVVVTLKALNLGVFPSTFSDHQVFKMEALNAYARFAAGVEQRRVHSVLKMTLGQLRIGLAGVRNAEAPKTLSEISVEDVVQRATGSRGGTILKVPQVTAVMETWQRPTGNQIDYIFKSAFEGKVEVGWNYSRISYIRGMWANHTKALEQVWGRVLPMTAVKITGVPETEGEGQQQKITAEVNVPQSKFMYHALEPPVIETPQLRDMGEATPPLEWIGLNRDKLPNLTHQIVIVSLLELAGEVEDAYSRILGSS